MVFLLFRCEYNLSRTAYEYDHGAFAGRIWMRKISVKSILLIKKIEKIENLLIYSA